MHGIIFSELQSYAEAKHGRGTWDVLLRKANLGSRVYLSLQEYPDAEIISLVMGVCAMTELSVSAVLEDFGQFIVPSLMRLYGHLLKPEWGAIDVIDHTEGTVHAVIRVKSPEAKPPKLKTQRSQFQRSASCLHVAPTNVRPGDRDWNGLRAALWREDRRRPNHVHAQGRDSL
jgi:hypothetical protein